MTLAAEAFALVFPGLGVEEVLAVREARDWWHFPAQDRARFESLLSVEVLDAHLRTDAARSPRVSMADEARPGSAGVPPEEYTLPDGRVDLPALLTRFDAGASLVLSQFHETHPPLGRFCRGMEKLFLHGVQANVYLTPPGAQGFRTHFDTHDVLVLQVDGHKNWRVWDGERLERPTRRTPWPGHLAPLGEPHLVALAPGDALYIPRGVMHDASTEDGARSLHITLGLLEPSWAQALRSLVDAAEIDDPALREAVPTWRIGEAELLPLLLEKLACLGTPAQAERLTTLMLDLLTRDRQPLPARGLFAPLPEGPLQLADGMHHHLTQGPDGSAALHWTGGTIPLTEAEAAEVTALAEGAVPTDAALAEKLWRLGLLEPAAG